MKSATDPCWTCGMETRHLFLTFRGTRNRNSFAVGGAEALHVKMDLDHLQKESPREAAHSPSAPVTLLRSDPTAITRVLSLPSHPPTLKNLIWLVPSQQISIDILSREGKTYRVKKTLHPAFVPRNGFLKHPGISDLLLNLVCVFFPPRKLKTSCIQQNKGIFKVFFLFFKIYF